MLCAEKEIARLIEKEGCPFFIMMVGLPGSGKSTLSAMIAETVNENKKWDKIRILSSDALRGEILGSEESQENNALIFSEMEKRALEAILEGKSVIYDCCSKNIKDRSSIIEKINKTGAFCKKIAYVVPTPYDECIRRAQNRIIRQVPNSVIERMLHGFQMPTYNEGFDYILINGYEYLFFDKDAIFCLPQFSCIQKLCGDMFNFNQHSSYHVNSLLVHSIKVAEKLAEEGNADPILINAALLHDYGKLYVQQDHKSIEGVKTYYNHANVGAYKLLSNFLELPAKTYNDKLKLIWLVNYHMLPFDFKKMNDSKVETYKEKLGYELESDLYKLHNADIDCSTN